MTDLIYRFLNGVSNSIKDTIYRLSRKMFLAEIKKKSNIIIGQGLILNGIPVFEAVEGASIEIGSNVTLTSRNHDYHINLHSSVRLFADSPGASIIIGDKCRIHGTCIHAIKRIEIGKNCLIAANCQIIDSNGHEISYPDVENRINTKGSAKPVKICDSVWIGADSFILPGVTVGRGSVISANSVVVSDIPEFVIAGGNPAVVIKKMRLDSQ